MVAASGALPELGPSGVRSASVISASGRSQRGTTRSWAMAGKEGVHTGLHMHEGPNSESNHLVCSTEMNAVL